MGRPMVMAWVVATLAMAASCQGEDETAKEQPTSDGGVESGVDASSLVDGAWVCTPKTCSQMNADCGDTSDGCGGIVACGTCPDGQTCGASGPNRCGVGTCTPTSCAVASAECGLIGDGCGNSLDCGTCTLPKTCGAGGEANKCSCIPTTCAIAGIECGSIPDGCGNDLDCGGCIAPKTCGGLGVANQCGCSPASCPPVYQNSFEAVTDFPTGWMTWHNCATDTTWSALREAFPAPSGGSYGLRLHTTGFAPACLYPGMYALTPPITALPGRVYRVLTWIKNGSSAGVTTLIFYDAADKQVGSGELIWAPDGGQYAADPPLIVTSPATTQTLRVRFGLQSPSQNADLDLLEVHVEPL